MFAETTVNKFFLNEQKEFICRSLLSSGFAMGLCKCPKRKVTNQFCFEHRVNVCEHCMVASHAKCVVQSYLAWLQVKLVKIKYA